MNTDIIRDAIRRWPFRPFTLRMKDGTTYYVPQPELAAVYQRIVFVFDKGEAGQFLEPNEIASLEPDPELPVPTQGK